MENGFPTEVEASQNLKNHESDLFESDNLINHNTKGENPIQNMYSWMNSTEDPGNKNFLAQMYKGMLSNIDLEIESVFDMVQNLQKKKNSILDDLQQYDLCSEGLKYRNNIKFIYSPPTKQASPPSSPKAKPEKEHNSSPENSEPENQIAFDEKEVDEKEKTKKKKIEKGGNSAVEMSEKLEEYINEDESESERDANIKVLKRRIEKVKRETEEIVKKGPINELQLKPGNERFAQESLGKELKDKSKTILKKLHDYIKNIKPYSSKKKKLLSRIKEENAEILKNNPLLCKTSSNANFYDQELEGMLSADWKWRKALESYHQHTDTQQDTPKLGKRRAKKLPKHLSLNQDLNSLSILNKQGLIFYMNFKHTVKVRNPILIIMSRYKFLQQEERILSYVASQLKQSRTTTKQQLKLYKQRLHNYHANLHDHHFKKNPPPLSNRQSLSSSSSSSPLQNSRSNSPRNFINSHGAAHSNIIQINNTQLITAGSQAAIPQPLLLQPVPVAVSVSAPPPTAPVSPPSRNSRGSASFGFRSAGFSPKKLRKEKEGSARKVDIYGNFSKESKEKGYEGDFGEFDGVNKYDHFPQIGKKESNFKGSPFADLKKINKFHGQDTRTLKGFHQSTMFQNEVLGETHQPFQIGRLKGGEVLKGGKIHSSLSEDRKKDGKYENKRQNVKEKYPNLISKVRKANRNYYSQNIIVSDTKAKLVKDPLLMEYQHQKYN